MNSNTNDIELAPDWPIAKVERSLASGDTKGLVKFLRSRLQNRFFEPIDYLKKTPASHVGYGFSMMSLCCLLVETPQCCREGVPTTNRREWEDLLKIQPADTVPTAFQLPSRPPINGRLAFQRFFDHHKKLFPSLDGGRFYDNVRNGLLHQAQTKGGWKINIKHSSVWDKGSSSINRDLFADALKRCFEAYLQELEASDKRRDDLRQKAARKIWWLIRLSRP